MKHWKRKGSNGLLCLLVLMICLSVTACPKVPSSRPTTQGYTKAELAELRRELDLHCPITKDAFGNVIPDQDCWMINRVVGDFLAERDKLRGKR